MKKIFKSAVLSIAAIMLIISTAVFPASAENAVLSFSSQKPSVGQSVTVTVTFNPGAKMYSADFSLSYNPDILTYESATCTAKAAGGGIVKAAPTLTGETKISYKFTFTAKKSGSSNITVSGGVYGFEDTENYNVGASATLTVSDAAKPGVATLKSLSISNGTLTPGFSTGRTSYTAKVKYEVTTCKVYATATDAKATVAVGGKEALAVGKNTRTVTVTAQNGTQKTYTIVITRLKEGEELDGETKPEDNTDEPEKSTVIDGVKYLLATDLSGFTLPNGFKANTVTYGETEVAAAQDTDANYTVYYLKGENSESYQPYTLESDGKTFKKLKFATFGNNTYIFADIPEGKTVPEGFYQSSVKIGDFDIPAYKSPDEGLTDFYYTYCFFEKNFAMYRYDSRENVLQRCPEFTLGDISTAAPKGAGFAARFASLSSNAKIIVVGIVILIIAAVALIVMLIVRMVKPRYDDDDGYDDDMFTNAFDSVTVEDGSEPKKETEEKTK